MNVRVGDKEYWSGCFFGEEKPYRFYEWDKERIGTLLAKFETWQEMDEWEKRLGTPEWIWEDGYHIRVFK